MKGSHPNWWPPLLPPTSLFIFSLSMRFSSAGYSVSVSFIPSLWICKLLYRSLCVLSSPKQLRRLAEDFSPARARKSKPYVTVSPWCLPSGSPAAAPTRCLKMNPPQIWPLPWTTTHHLVSTCGYAFRNGGVSTHSLPLGCFSTGLMSKGNQGEESAGKWSMVLIKQEGGSPTAGHGPWYY